LRGLLAGLLGWAHVLLLVLACVLAAGPPALAGGADPEQDSDAATPSIAGGWLAVTPLSFAWPSAGVDVEALRRAVRFGYRWGFDAGVSWVPRTRRGDLWLSVSAGFEQTLWITRNASSGAAEDYTVCFRGDCYGWDERAVVQLLRVGPVLRIGWLNRWALVWARASVQLGVGRVRLDCNNSFEAHCNQTETDLGPGLGGGLGAAWRITPVVAVGLEAKLDHVWLDRRDDPFRAARTLDLGLMVALRF
jgi:hypothetical protein